MVEFLSEINWSPLWISLKTGVAATIFAFFLGVFCARKIMKLKPGSKGSAGWDSDNASCSASYSSWILPAFAF